MTSQNFNPFEPNKGEDRLSPEEIRTNLPETFRQIPIQVHPTLDSTNLYAKKLAEGGAPSGTLVLSEEQTAGRGRQEKRFFSPPKSGLYMTVILRPNLPLTESLILTFAAGIAVCDAIETLTGYSPKIKWVNDVYLDRKKICGILAETAGGFKGNIPDAIVVGIGVNVRMDLDDLPQELQGMAGCLFPIQHQRQNQNQSQSQMEEAFPLTRNRLAAEIAGRLLLFTEKLSGPAREDEKRRLLLKYKQKSLILGKKVQYVQGATTHSGVALDIGEDGSLFVKNESGETIPLQSGEITLVKDSLWGE